MTRGYNTISESKLKRVVSESFSFTEVARKLNKKPVGGTLTNIVLRCKRLNIDVNHFTGQAHGKGKKAKNRLSPEDRLVFGKPTDHRTAAVKLRQSLFEIGVEHKCCVCGIVEWQGKPIVLEIDHKNGQYWNNLKENLQFVCPNCHSQKRKLETQ